MVARLGKEKEETVEQGPEELPDEHSGDRDKALQDLTDKPLDDKGAGAKPTEGNDDTGSGAKSSGD